METKETKTCACCGRVFVPEDGRQIYCRRDDCYAGHRAKLKREQNYRSRMKKIGAHMLNGKVVQHCIVCGKQFLVENFRTKLCSEECKRIRNNYTQRLKYAKDNGLELPEPPKPAKQSCVEVVEDNKKIYETKSQLERERRKEMYEQSNQAPVNPIRGLPKRRYTHEELNEKLDAKTKRIIEAIHALESADIDESVVFEAVKSITRMPLNEF